MNGHAAGRKLSQLPDEMFTLIKSSSQTLGPRLGKLALTGRRVLDTPHYLGNTSRGVVPHITQDTFRRDTDISGVYIGLEDFIERNPPPLYKFQPPDGASPLRRFVALPDDTVIVVGARRTPPVAAPAANPNTSTTISVGTSVGFKLLQAEDYANTVEGLKADVVVGLGDIPYGRALGSKRIEKAVDRNIQWLQDHVAVREIGKDGPQAKLFASLLPVSCAKQQFYIDCLTDELAHGVAGLAIYDADSLEDLPNSLSSLPRLSFLDPKCPMDVLRHVSSGIDIFTVPFIGAATDAGIALDFQFPAAVETASDSPIPLPLGLDMWSPTHAVDLSPLSKDCFCYACSGHHRAYIQHLLAAKEMLGWVLLQIHNHHIMDRFFNGIRSSISNATFEQDMAHFEKFYERQMPEKTGQGPRVRGYQFKSEGPGPDRRGEAKKNKSAFHTLNDSAEKLAEATPPNAKADADVLQA
ncbi:related to tRNA-guanine transglycosylase family [Lecanosticta acicola]|uniref:Queuine tRNA-ribosyltransferase accessory subunit 2 n=1 Tax=Lecanosticta acicola TaxID=111012 RepID=A0AAI8YW30_9PEZI|nr:related to tRNA-guanine transglycosylase family [Lecanosticta acicola]